MLAHLTPPWQYKHTALRATAALVALATAMLFCFSKLLGVCQQGQNAPSRQRQSRLPAARGALVRAHGGPLGSSAELRPLQGRVQPRSLSETPPKSPMAPHLAHAIQVLYLVAIFTTSLLCPMLLVHLQQYRATACWKRRPGGATAHCLASWGGVARQLAMLCAWAQWEAVVRLEARPTWPTLRRPTHRRRHPGAMGRGRPCLSACAVRLADMRERESV